MSAPRRARHCRPPGACKAAASRGWRSPSSHSMNRLVARRKENASAWSVRFSECYDSAMSHFAGSRPKPDQVLADIADYVCDTPIDSALAVETARHCLLDTLGCGLEALEYPACTKLLGPLVPGTVVPNGARVPGTQFQLDPVQAAFNIGSMIRWLDFNDTWLAAEWGHPSDNLGGILAVADWISRNAVAAGRKPLTVRDVLTAMIKAHEIQGVIALENSFNRVGLDHVVLVKVASTAVVAHMLGLTREEM